MKSRRSNHLRIRYDDGSFIRCPKCRSTNWQRGAWAGVQNRWVLRCVDCGRVSTVAYDDRTNGFAISNADYRRQVEQRDDPATWSEERKKAYSAMECAVMNEIFEHLEDYEAGRL